jgi:hypothetical protein
MKEEIFQFSVHALLHRGFLATFWRRVILIQFSPWEGGMRL